MTLLIVQPLTPQREPVGKPLVVADAMGAGVGEEVFFVRGKEASFPFHPAEPPVDAGIVGITDYWDTSRMRFLQMLIESLTDAVPRGGTSSPRGSTRSSKAPS